MIAEDELVRFARAGDRAALEQLLRANQDDLYRFSLRLMWSNRELAEDLAQETMLAAIEGIQSFKGTSKFRTWLFGIAYNNFRGQMKIRRRKREILEVSGEEVADRSDSADDVASENERRDLMALAFSKLASGQREAVYLRDILGCSYSEAATVLGISLNSVKNRVHNGRQNMISTISRLTEQSPENKG